MNNCEYSVGMSDAVVARHILHHDLRPDLRNDMHDDMLNDLCKAVVDYNCGSFKEKCCSNGIAGWVNPKRSSMILWSVSNDNLFVTFVFLSTKQRQRHHAQHVGKEVPMHICLVNAWCFILIKPLWLWESDLLHLPTRMGKASRCWKVLPAVTATNTHLHMIQTLNMNSEPCSSRWYTTLSLPMHSCPVMQDSKPRRGQCQMAALPLKIFHP